MKNETNSIRPKGEVMVWFTSLGLALGLLLIVGLIGLIVYKGMLSFWPQRVVQIELKEESEFKVKGSTTAAGEIAKTQERIDREVKEESLLETDANLEWQLHVGNKDLYGYSYKYFDTEDILSTTYPKDLLFIERDEFGDAIFYPQYIKLKNGDKIQVDDPNFNQRLEELIDKKFGMRAELLQLEKYEIGAVNRKMEDLKLKKKGLERSDKDQATKDKMLAEMKEKQAQLQKEFEVLATKSRSMRNELVDIELHGVTADGTKIMEPLGEIYDHYYPNQLSFTERVGHFFYNFWSFLSDDPREANMEGGIFPAIFGTFVMTLLLSVAVTPFGVMAAIYLSEYAKQGPLVRSIRISINNLAGVPSIVFGVFGMGFFVYYLGGTIDELFFHLRLPSPTFGTGGILWASLTLALMTVPVVVVATEEALSAVTRGTREASLACGASKWQTIKSILLPASTPGILTGLILAMARGAGEVAPLMLVGVVKLAPALPLDGEFPYLHLERKFMHLGFHIYDLGFQSPDSEAAQPMVFATTFLLILLVVILNLGAIMIRNHIRKKYQSATF